MRGAVQAKLSGGVRARAGQSFTITGMLPGGYQVWSVTRWNNVDYVDTNPTWGTIGGLLGLGNDDSVGEYGPLVWVMSGANTPLANALIAPTPSASTNGVATGVAPGPLNDFAGLGCTPVGGISTYWIIPHLTTDQAQWKFSGLAPIATTGTMLWSRMSALGVNPQPVQLTLSWLNNVNVAANIPTNQGTAGIPNVAYNVSAGTSLDNQVVPPPWVGYNVTVGAGIGFRLPLALASDNPTGLHALVTGLIGGPEDVYVDVTSVWLIQAPLGDVVVATPVVP